MRSPPGSVATKPPPTPMASLGDDMAEIDTLLAASRRARESVADRSSGLYEEHLATQRKFDLELQRETLKGKPGMATTPRADHSLMFHLGANQESDDVQATTPTKGKVKKDALQLPEDAVVPPPPAYASESEAKEWDDYYRYCARGALFKALDKGRMTELELGQKLAQLALEADALPRYGNEDDYYDETSPEVLLELARIRDVDGRVKTSRTHLYRTRKVAYDEIKGRLDAYGPKKIRDPGFPKRMRDLGLRLPTGPALVKEAEAEYALQKAREKAEARLKFAPAPVPSELYDEYYEEDFQETPRELHAPELTAADIVERQARVAGQMSRHIKRDKHVMQPLHRLPADPQGLPKDALFSHIAAEHTVSVDLAFPSLDAYRRSEHDVAAYFAPGYTAHLSELDAKPHAGGFWTGIRAETRTMKSDLPSPTTDRAVALAPVAAPTRTLKRVLVRTTALESFRDAMETGAACLASVALPETARQALEGPRFALAIDACGDVLDMALDGSAGDRALIADALARVCASQAALPILDSARAPTAPECDLYARVVAAAARREDDVAPASFEHLCAFCCIAAALEDAAADELAQARRQADRGAFEAEKAYRELVRAPPHSKEECLDWVDELHACHALSEGAAQAIAEAIPARPSSIAAVVAAAGFEASADACAVYEALHETARPRLARSGDTDAAALLLYALILAALDEARPAAELAELARTTAAAAGAPDLYRAKPVTEVEEPEKEEEESGPELLMVRAFRRAVKEAGNTFDGASGTVDFDAAFAALAGQGMETIPPQLCAPLLRPFATHWGAEAGKALAAAPYDTMAQTKVAALLAASTNGQVTARSLELFIVETAPATAAVPEGEVSPVLGRRICVLRSGAFAAVTATAAPGAAAGSAWMLHGLVCPGGIRSQVAVSLDDLPPGTDVEGLPGGLLRFARFDEAGMLTGVFA